MEVYLIGVYGVRTIQQDKFKIYHRESAKIPLPIASMTPFSTALINSRLMAPPTILSSIQNRFPALWVPIRQKMLA